MKAKKKWTGESMPVRAMYDDLEGRVRDVFEYIAEEKYTGPSEEGERQKCLDHALAFLKGTESLRLMKYYQPPQRTIVAEIVSQIREKNKNVVASIAHYHIRRTENLCGATTVLRQVCSELSKDEKFECFIVKPKMGQSWINDHSVITKIQQYLHTVRSLTSNQTIVVFADDCDTFLSTLRLPPSVTTAKIFFISTTTLQSDKLTSERLLPKMIESVLQNEECARIKEYQDCIRHEKRIPYDHLLYATSTDIDDDEYARDILWGYVSLMESSVKHNVESVADASRWDAIMLRIALRTFQKATAAEVMFPYICIALSAELRKSGLPARFFQQKFAQLQEDVLIGRTLFQRKASSATEPIISFRSTRLARSFLKLCCSLQECKKLFGVEAPKEGKDNTFTMKVLFLKLFASKICDESMHYMIREVAMGARSLNFTNDDESNDLVRWNESNKTLPPTVTFLQCSDHATLRAGLGDVYSKFHDVTQDCDSAIALAKWLTFHRRDVLSDDPTPECFTRAREVLKKRLDPLALRGAEKSDERLHEEMKIHLYMGTLYRREFFLVTRDQPCSLSSLSLADEMKCSFDEALEILKSFEQLERSTFKITPSLLEGIQSILDSFKTVLQELTKGLEVPAKVYKKKSEVIIELCGPGDANSTTGEPLIFKCCAPETDGNVSVNALDKHVSKVETADLCDQKGFEQIVCNIRWGSGATICDILNSVVAPQYYEDILTRTIDAFDRALRYAAFGEGEREIQTCHMAASKLCTLIGTADHILQRAHHDIRRRQTWLKILFYQSQYSEALSTENVKTILTYLPTINDSITQVVSLHKQHHPFDGLMVAMLSMKSFYIGNPPFTREDVWRWSHGSTPDQFLLKCEEWTTIQIVRVVHCLFYNTCIFLGKLFNGDLVGAQEQYYKYIEKDDKALNTVAYLSRRVNSVRLQDFVTSCIQQTHYVFPQVLVKKSRPAHPCVVVTGKIQPPDYTRAVISQGNQSTNISVPVSGFFQKVGRPPCNDHEQCFSVRVGVQGLRLHPIHKALVGCCNMPRCLYYHNPSQAPTREIQVVKRCVQACVDDSDSDDESSNEPPCEDDSIPPPAPNVLQVAPACRHGPIVPAVLGSEPCLFFETYGHCPHGANCYHNEFHREHLARNGAVPNGCVWVYTSKSDYCVPLPITKLIAANRDKVYRNICGTRKLHLCVTSCCQCPSVHTEAHPVMCPYYDKSGACPLGDNCPFYPSHSMIRDMVHLYVFDTKYHMYRELTIPTGNNTTKAKAQNHKFQCIMPINVCDYHMNPKCENGKQCKRFHFPKSVWCWQKKCTDKTCRKIHMKFH
eukprot:PhF_6_TR26931/c0_g2_i1/m.39270